MGQAAAAAKKMLSGDVWQQRAEQEYQGTEYTKESRAKKKDEFRDKASKGGSRSVGSGQTVADAANPNGPAQNPKASFAANAKKLAKEQGVSLS
jgi:pyruvate/2-oxoglutarate dehydrogenase complex dihydrolipoamide acyltransferase (E2) component